MKANVLKGLFIGILLLTGVVLATGHAVMQEEAGSNPLGMLAYIQGGHLWVKALPDGQAKRLSTDGETSNSRWSPSGEWLAYLKGSEFWVVQRSGADAKVLNSGVIHFAWSPDGKCIAYVAAPEEAAGGGRTQSPVRPAPHLDHGSGWLSEASPDP